MYWELSGTPKIELLPEIAAFCREIILQKAPLQMLDYVLNIPLTPLNCQPTNFPNYNEGWWGGGEEEGSLKI